MPPGLPEPAEGAGRLSRIASDLLVAGLLLACAWLTALLPPNLVLDHVVTSRGYDDQALAWLDGRWDLPHASIGLEAFEVDGRYYMYFAPTPALLRLPFAELLTAFPAKAGFLSVFAAVVVGVWAALRIFEELDGAPPGPIAVVALAGPPLIIASRVIIYHEAIAWGSAFALLAALQALRYHRRPSLPRLASLAVTAFLAAFAREIWLLGMIVLLVMVACAALVRAGDPAQRFRGPGRLKAWLRLPDVDRPALHAGVAVTAVALTLFTAAAIHRAKFGGWGFVPPIEQHSVFSRDPGRLARIGRGLFHLANLRTGLYSYLSLSTVSWAPTFPWLKPVVHPRVFPEAYVDGFEHLMGLPHVAGALMLSGAAGLAAAARGRARRDALPVLASLALSAAACFFFVGFCGRYLYDFYPALVVAGGLGWAVLRRVRSPWARAGFTLLALFNLTASAALAATIQRLGGPTPARLQVQSLADRIDRVILRPEARLEDRTCPMHGARRIVLRLRPAGRPLDRDDPVIVTGSPGRANFVSLRRFADGTGAFAFRAWGSREVFGRRFRINSGDWHELDVRFEPAGVVWVFQDGLPTLVTGGTVHETLGHTVWLGRNPHGGPALAPRFAGVIDCAPSYRASE
jgi:hypothetical protein